MSSACFAAEKILVVGDSLSAAYGIDIKQGWVALLQERLQKDKLDYDVINASISGDTTSNGLARLPNVLKDKPAIVILELGANDGLRGLPLNIIKNNLAKMIELIKKNNSKVILIGLRLPPNYGAAYTEQFQTTYKKLAEKYKISYLPFLLESVDNHRDLFQSDGLHPTAAAQERIEENVWGVLKPLL